jgi:adenylate kinase
MQKTVICISGVPGTGKTVIANALAQQLGASVVHITELIKSVPFTWDTKRKTKIIRVSDLQIAINKIIKKTKQTLIIEGHLAHLLRCDFCVILRCNPLLLKSRLKKRKWPKQKISENVAAEILDVILFEALTNKKCKRLYEIDVSNLSPKQIVGKIARYLKSRKKRKLLHVDWMRKYHTLLTKK